MATTLKTAGVAAVSCGLLANAPHPTLDARASSVWKCSDGLHSGLSVNENTAVHDQVPSNHSVDNHAYVLRMDRGFCTHHLVPLLVAVASTVQLEGRWV